MGRQPCCDKVGLKRGPWTIEEDNKLINFILNNGIQCWRLVPKLAGLMRCGKSCRLRWINYLRPDLKRGAWTEAEEDMVIQLHSRLGNRWSKIAAHFPGRTDNEIKNHWNTKIKKKLKLLGLDPLTHKPIEQNEKITKKDVGEQEMMMMMIKTDSHEETAISEDDFQMQKSTDETHTPSLDEQKSGGKLGSSNSGLLNEESTANLACKKFNEMKAACPEMGSALIPNNTQQLPLEDSFHLGMGDSHHQLEDSFQNWINSPLPWDIFTTLEENFLLE